MLLSSFNIYSPERISNSIKNKAKEEKYVTTQIQSYETFLLFQLKENNKNNTFKVLYSFVIRALLRMPQ